MRARDVVFIHGMFMTPLCWEEWLGYFEGKGYRCIAPAWPGRDKSIQAQREAHPDPELGRLKLRDVIEHMEHAIGRLSGKPVLIGHSMGGLVVQLLLQKDLAAAGVAIDPAPPAGVISTAWSFLRANFPAINPFVPVTHPVRMSFEQFQYTFVNTLPRNQQRAAYDRYIVPESRGVPTQSLTAVARVDFKRAHAPLLITAGEKDHIIPASLNRSNYQKYQDSASVTDFREFPGRDHFVIGEDGWEEVASFVLGWLKEKIPS
jgi:pimeloyl-ACP methyl ester carboxylesterase